MSDNQERSESGSPVYRHQARDLSDEPIITDREGIEKLEDRIQSLGQGWVFHEIKSELIHLDVHVIPPTPERNYYTLITAGMSDRPMNTPDGAHHVRYGELMLCLPPEWNLKRESLKDEKNYWPIRTLKTLARLPHEYNTWLGVVHTVRNGDPPAPYATNTKLCCALMLVPMLLNEELAEIKVREDKTIYFMSVVPIYKEEMDFKLNYGADALLERFENIGLTELIDLKRQNVCK